MTEPLDSRELGSSLLSQAGIAPGPPLPSLGTPGAAAAPVALSGRTVRMVSPLGVVGDVPEEQAQQAQADGYTVETPNAAAVREYVSANRGLSGQAKVALGQFADEALFGIPEIVHEKTQDPLEVAKWEALKKEHAYSNAIGGLGGFGASLFLGGPLFKGAAAAGRAAEAGILAERLAAAGAEQAVAHGVARRAVASAAKLGVEAGVVVVLVVITEAALGDPEEAAETMLYNFGAGAALGSLSPVAKELFAKAVKGSVVPGGTTKLEAYANEQAIKSLDPYKRISDRLAEIPGGKDAAGEIIREKGLVRRVGEDFEELVGRIDAEKSATGDAIGDLYKQLDESGVTFDSREVARQMRKEVLGPLGKKVGWDAKESKVARYIESFETKTVEDLDPIRLMPEPKRQEIPHIGEAEVLAELKAKYPGQGLRFSKNHIRKFLMEVEGAPLEEIVARRQAEAAMATETAYNTKLAEVAEENLKRYETHQRLARDANSLKPTDLVGIRQDLDRLLYGEKLPSPDQIDQELKSIRDLYKGQLDKAVVEHLGEEKAAQLAKLNTEFRVLSTIGKGAQKNIGRDLTNRTNGLTDYLMGAGQASIGGIIGHAVGGPVGGMIGAGSSQLLGMLGNKYFRQNYNALAVRGADKLAILLGEQSMKKVAFEFDRIPTLFGEMKGKVSKAEPVTAMAELLGLHAPGSSTASKAEQFEALSKLLSEAVTNGPKTTEVINKLTGALAEGGAPEIAAKLAEKQLATIQYLYEKMPKAPAPKPFSPAAKWTPSPAQITEWESRVEVAVNPMAVLKHLKQGTLTRAHTETLQAVYPRLYATIKARIGKLAADPNGPVLGYGHRAAVRALMGAASEQAKAPPPPVVRPVSTGGGGKLTGAEPTKVQQITG